MNGLVCRRLAGAPIRYSTAILLTCALALAATLALAGPAQAACTNDCTPGGGGGGGGGFSPTADVSFTNNVVSYTDSSTLDPNDVSVTDTVSCTTVDFFGIPTTFCGGQVEVVDPNVTLVPGSNCQQGADDSTVDCDYAVDNVGCTLTPSGGCEQTLSGISVSTGGGSDSVDITGVPHTPTTISAGDGNDTVNALNGNDADTVACGAGTDTATADGGDTVNADCETQHATPHNTAAPTISGNAVDESVLTASPGTWSGASSLTYQWLRCFGNICNPISNATGNQYTLTPDDINHQVEVRVTGTNQYGSENATSAPTGTVQAKAPTSTHAPTISGTPEDGQTLTTDGGTWGGTPGGLSYQWERCDATGGNCNDIVSADAHTSHYTLGHDDVGHEIRVEATMSNGAGSASSTSDPTSAVMPAPPVNNSLPTVTGQATEDQQLTGDPGTWGGTPGTLSYQWRRCNSSGQSCTDIAGETGQNHTLVLADVGHTIVLRVTDENGAGSTSADSDPTDVVQANPAHGAPTLNVQVPKQTTRSVIHHGLTVNYTCSVQCSANGALKVGARVAKRYGMKGAVTLGTGSDDTPDTAQGTFVVEPSKAGKRLLRKVTSSITAKLTATATDQGGHQSFPAKQKVKLSR